MTCNCDVERDGVHSCCDEEQDAALTEEDIKEEPGEFIELEEEDLDIVLETRLDMMRFCLEVCCTEFNKVNPPRARKIKKLASELLLEFLRTVDPEEYEDLVEEDDEGLDIQ